MVCDTWQPCLSSNMVAGGKEIGDMMDVRRTTDLLTSSLLSTYHTIHRKKWNIYPTSSLLFKLIKVIL